MKPFLKRSDTSTLRGWLAGLSAFVLAASITACGSSSGSSSSGGSHDNVSIGLVTKTETNPYFVHMEDTAKEKAKHDGVKLTALSGKSDGDNAGQIKALENLTAKNVDGILITPNNSSGVLKAVKTARDQGIRVFALDTKTDPANAVNATFGTDNYKAGKKEGKYVKTRLHGATPKVLAVDGSAGAEVDEQRHKGFIKGIGISESDLLAHESTHGDQNKAQEAMERLLKRKKNSRVNAVYTINEPAARGSYTALKKAHLTDQAVIGSIDGSCDGVKDVAKGKYAATVMQFPKKMVTQGMNSVENYTKHKKKISGFHPVKSVLITDKPTKHMKSKSTEWGKKHCWG